MEGSWNGSDQKRRSRQPQFGQESHTFSIPSIQLSETGTVSGQEALEISGCSVDGERKKTLPLSSILCQIQGQIRGTLFPFIFRGASMPIAMPCPQCKAKLKGPDQLVGHTLKCPGCGTPVTITAAVRGCAETAGVETAGSAANGEETSRQRVPQYGTGRRWLCG